jgi:PAS domain S-box-containing protein
VLAVGPSAGGVVTLRARPIVDGRGKIIGASTVLLETRRLIHRAMRHFDAVFRRFAERVPDAVAIHERGRLLYANEATAKALGYESASELVGRDVLEIVAPVDRVAVADRVRAMYEDRVSVPVREELLLHRDGSLVPASIAALPFPTPNGRGVVVVAHFLVEEKRAEALRVRLAERVRAQLELFEEIVEVAPVGIALLRGPELVFEVVNAAFQAFSPGVVLRGRRFAEAAPEMEALRGQLERVVRTGESAIALDAPLPIQRHEGGPIEEAWFAYAAVRARCTEGDGVLGIVVETTEQVLARRRIEELADESRVRAAELRAVLENMVEGVMVLDTDLRVVMVNASMRTMFASVGIDTPERFDLEMLQKLDARDLEGGPVRVQDTMVFRALRTGKAGRSDYVVHDVRTGRRVATRISGSPIRDERGQLLGAVLVASDVTAETELDRMKTQFIRVAAHELKTPVTVMKGYAEALLRDTGARPPARALEAIGRGADRIDRIVRDLLDISGFELGVLELAKRPFRLNDLLSEEVAVVAARAPRHVVAIACTVPAIVVGDRARLRQVLENLLENAIRYSPEGGRIEVSLVRDGPRAVVSVADEGVGIPEDKQAHIFERFYRAHTDTPFDYGGMGVGLYIARQIVERHGGRVGFGSREGRGSRFWFSLPASEP